MKHLARIMAGALALGLCAAFTACTTVTPRSVSSTNEIKSEKLVLNSYFDRSDYSVIRTVQGESEFVYWDGAKFVGDSGKYGYIYEPSGQNLGDGIFVGTGKRLAASAGDSAALTRARLNANWQLIENAYAMGGDSIFEPVYSVESVSEGEGTTVRQQYKVTVRAKVIQLKDK